MSDVPIILVELLERNTKVMVEKVTVKDGKSFEVPCSIGQNASGYNWIYFDGSILVLLEEVNIGLI